MTQTPPPSQEPTEGLAAPEYFVLPPGGEFLVILPDNTSLKICTPFEENWEIRRYDNESESPLPIERTSVRRVRAVDGEATEPLRPNNQ